MALICPEMCSRVQELSNKSKNTQFGVRGEKVTASKSSQQSVDEQCMLRPKFVNFTIFGPLLGPISQDTIKTCFLDFFRVRLGWKNTYSRVSLILSLNHLRFLIFCSFYFERGG